MTYKNNTGRESVAAPLGVVVGCDSITAVPHSAMHKQAKSGGVCLVLRSPFLEQQGVSFPVIYSAIGAASYCSMRLLPGGRWYRVRIGMEEGWFESVIGSEY